MSSFAGIFPLLFFAEVFCVTFFAGFPMHGLWHGFYHGLFLGDCFSELLLMDDFHGLFRGAFSAVAVSVSAFAGLFLLGLFRKVFSAAFPVVSFQGTSSVQSFAWSIFMPSFAGFLLHALSK